MDNSSHSHQSHSPPSSGGGGEEMARAAIQALYGSDSALREEANSFLNNLSEDDSSWGICVNLLQDNNEQIQFFAANMLYTKVKKSWHKLDANAQGTIAVTLENCIKNHGVMQFKTVISRVCSTFAAVASRSDGGIPHYVCETIKMASTAPQLQDLVIMLEMLRVLPHEVETFGRIGASRDALRLELAAQLKSVLEVVVFVLSNHQALAVPALQVIKGWAKHRSGLHLTALIRDFGAVYEALCHCFNTEQIDLIQTAGEVMAEIVQLADPSDRAAREGALMIFFEVLTKRIPHCFQIAQWAEEEEACFALCYLATAICRLELEYVAEAKNPLCLEAVDFLVVCTGCPQRRVSSLCLDFWLCLQDIGLEDRHVALGPPLYANLLDVLLAQCSYPEGGDFLTAGLDEDEWASFREGSQGAKEVLITVFYALGFEYVVVLAKRLQEPNQGWEAKEVCLFALQAASQPVVDMLSSLDPKGYTEAQAGCLEALTTTLSSLASDPLYKVSPAMMRTGSQLILSTAKLFKLLPCEKGSVVLSLVGYLGTAAQCSDPKTSHAAALGFRMLCPSAKDALMTNEQSLTLLVETWQSVAVSSILLEDLLLMTEAVTRLLVSLPKAKVKGAISMFMGPVVTSVHQALAQPQPDEVFVSNHLRILTTAIRFLDFAQQSDGSHVADEFLNALYPVMQETLVKLQDKEEATARLFDLMGKLFINLRETVAPQVELLLQAAVDSYRVHHFPGALTALAAAVEAYGNMESLRNYFMDLFNFVCQETFPHLHISAELAAGFFDMAYRFLLFAPFAVLEPASLLETTMHAGIANLDNADRDAAKNAINFVTHIVTRCDGLLDGYRSQIGILVVSTLGQELMNAVIVGLTKSVHPHLRSNLAACLYAVVFSFCENNRADMCHQCIEATLLIDPLKDFFVSPESRKQLADCFLNLAQKSKARFKAMALDLAKICNKEATTDVMVGYFM